MPFLPEDVVVTQILPRLAVKTLFKFKCVSKRYNAIISSPRFAQHYLQRAYTCREPRFSSPGLVCGLLLPLLNWSFEDEKNIKDLNDDNDADSNDDGRTGSIHLYSASLRLNYDLDWNNTLVFSSNGLVLSRFHGFQMRYTASGCRTPSPSNVQYFPTQRHSLTASCHSSLPQGDAIKKTAIMVDSVPRGFSCRCPRAAIMVAPNPRNPHLVCLPGISLRYLTILDFRDLTWKDVDVDLRITLPGKPLELRKFTLCRSFVPIQVCPWSSPFYNIR